VGTGAFGLNLERYHLKVFVGDVLHPEHDLLGRQWRDSLLIKVLTQALHDFLHHPAKFGSVYQWRHGLTSSQHR
jgi:hypothetical protein